MTYREGLDELLNILAKEDNMTNGDIIKTVFPDVIGYGAGETCIYYGTMRFDTTWWNAPYERKVEE